MFFWFFPFWCSIRRIIVIVVVLKVCACTWWMLTIKSFVSETASQHKFLIKLSRAAHESKSLWTPQKCSFWNNIHRQHIHKLNDWGGETLISRIRGKRREREHKNTFYEIPSWWYSNVPGRIFVNSKLTRKQRKKIDERASRRAEKSKKSSEGWNDF